MGRITEMVVGAFIIGGSYGLRMVGDTIFGHFDPGNADLPFDYAAMIQYGSTGLFYLGVAIIGYAVTRLILGGVYGAWKHRETDDGITRERVEERRKEYLQRRQEQGGRGRRERRDRRRE